MENPPDDKKNQGPAGPSVNPMKDCQEDVFSLVKNLGMLKRTLEEEKMKWESDTQKILLNVLSIVDSFRSRFGEIEQKKEGLSEETLSWISKFTITYKKLMNVIKECGITPIEIVAGEKFNAELHNAVETEEKKDTPDGTILEEIYAGYRWKGKVLRPSDVKVARNKQ
jgi:molecular chaperone GrpE